MTTNTRTMSNVLCIDDDDEYNFLTQEAFYDVQYKGKLTFKTSAEDALTYLDSLTTFPDVIILDINMPAMNGWDFLDAYEARRFPLAGETLIFMHSSSVFDSDRERAARYPCVKGFIDKPILQENIEDICSKYFSAAS